MRFFSCGSKAPLTGKQPQSICTLTEETNGKEMFVSCVSIPVSERKVQRQEVRYGVNSLRVLCNKGCGQFIYISKTLTCSPNTSITCIHTHTHWDIQTHMHPDRNVHSLRQGQQRITLTFARKWRGAVVP